MVDLNDLLGHLIEQKGSDLHMKVGSVPHLRIHGRLRPTPFAPSTLSELGEVVADLVPTARTRDLAERGEVSIAHGVPGLGRFRVNVYRQRGSYGLSVRLVSPGAPAIESLGLPATVTALAEGESGLVLVSGPASSGKTTTAAAILDHVNRTRAVHIVTLEDPIEVLIADKSSMVSQREIGVDARSTIDAMRRVTHLDPDVIYVSDLADAETIFEVLSAASAGRLVVATTPAASVAGTIAHVLAHFEVARQPRIRRLLATTLKGIVCQQLLDAADGTGLAAATEVLIDSPDVARALIDGGEPDALVELMARGERGMQTMDQSLATLVRDGKVTLAVAIGASDDPEALAAAVGVA